MPRLYKQAADSRDASEGGAFERFIASAIATLVTILLSWRILLELGGSEGGGDRDLAAADEDAPETDTTGDDKRPVSDQQVSNVVLDMEAAATAPHLSASATIDTDSTPTATGGKRIGRSDRINKVYEYLNLTMPDDPEHSHKTGQDTDTQSLGDTSSEDDAVTVIEKPLLAEDQEQNATFPVETRDVIDVSRCNVGFATCAAVTSSQTCATGCERIWPELYGDRICNRDYGASAVSCDTRPCSNVPTSNTDVVIGNEIRVAEDDVIVARSRSDRDSDLGQTTGETLTDNVAYSSALWPTNGDDNTTPTNGTDNNNDADIQNNTDLVFAGDSIKHAGPESCSRDTLTCSIHETPEPARVIAKLVIPEVFQRDVTSLPPPIVPRAVRDDCVSAIGGLANSSGAGRIYDFTVGPDMHIDDVKQTRDLHPLNLTAATSSVTFVHSSDTRASTCTGDNQRATTNVTAPGISSQETLCPGLRVLPGYIATDATGGINTSLQGRFYFTSFCDRVNNLGVYADARLSSCVEAPPNRCVFVKTEFIVHDYHIRNTNVVQFDRLTDLVDITHDPSTRSKTAALEADHKTNNMTNIGHNTNTRTQSAREECSPAVVDLYNPRCKVRRDISSTDTSAGSLFLGMGRLPNSASVESSTARSTAPGYGDIAGVHESASMTDRHQDDAKMILESRSVWEDKEWNGKSDMFPRRHLTGGDLPAKQPPSRTPIKSDIHAMYRDDIISHKGEPTENRPVHLAWANRSTGIGDNACGIRADVAASVAGISYAGRGGPIAATAASRPTCTDRAGASLSDAGLAVSHGASLGVDGGQLSNGARSNPPTDTDIHGNDTRQQCLDNGVRNCHVTGQQCDRCTLDRTVASYTPQNIVISGANDATTNRGFSVRSTNAQNTTIQGASDIPQEYYNTTNVCTLIDTTAEYSFERRADKIVNGNTHSVNTHTPSEYDSGDIDIVHYSTAASDTRCHDRTGTVGWVRDTSSHGHPQWTKRDANIDTAIRPATEQLQSRDIAHNAAAPDRQVSTDSTQHNSVDNVDGTPTVTSRDIDSWIRVPIPDHNARAGKRSKKPTGFPYTVSSPTGSCHDRVTGPKSSSVTISDADGQPVSVSTGRSGNVGRNPQRTDVGPAPDIHTANTEPRMAVNPEVGHAMNRTGATGSCVNVVPIVTTSARSHDNMGTRIKSILKVSPTADIDSNRRNDATRENSARAKMDIDDRFRCINGRRIGDENTPHESRFEQSTCSRPELVTTPTRLKVFEIEYTDTAIAVSDVVNGRRCENEQLDDRPVLPFGGCSYNDAWQHERSGDLPEAGDLTTSLAYDAIDPIGYRYSPDGYRRGAYGGGGCGGGGGSSVCSSVGSGTWRARSMSTLACEFFADRSSRTSLLETDLDTGEQRATPLVRETDIDYARSMTDLAHPACAPADDIMTRSLVAFPGDHSTTPAELTLSANELRIRQSLSKLSVPQWYAVAATRQNRDVIRLKNVERAGVASSPRRSLHLSTPNIARQSTKPVVINYRVKTPLRARSPATTPTVEFELPSAKFRKQPSTWTRIETRQPPPPEGIRTSRSAREAYLRLKREQEAAKGRDCKEGHLTSNVAGEAAQGRSGSTRSCRSVLTTPPGSVTEASIRARAAGISEGARRHSGGKGSYPVMGTRINLAEFGNKSAKPDVDSAHSTSNGHHSVTFATQQPRGYHVTQNNAARGDLSTARYDNEAKQMEEVLNSLLGIPSALPSNNISPLSTPLRHIPTHVTSGVADTSGDDENLDVVVTCRNPKCGRQASLSEARTCYKTCHNCYTYYCSRACRQTHWQRHKRRCVFSRVGSLCKNVIRRVHDDATLSAEMTRVARAGYLASGRGCVNVSFPSQAEADALLVRQDDQVTTPVFVSLAVLEDGATADEHFFELTDLCKTYNPQVKYVIDVAITAAAVSDADDLPASPSRRGGDSRTVSKCAKLRLHLPLSPRHTTRPEPDTLILTAVPGSELTENVAGRRARQICFVNMQRKLRQRGVSLRHQYPGVYDKLCAYVTENEHFAPITLFPLNRHTGRKFMCLIMPNSEPDVAWMHQPDLLDEIGLSTAV